MNRILSLLIVSLFLLGPLTALPVGAQVVQPGANLSFRDVSFADNAIVTDAYGTGSVVFIHLLDSTSLADQLTVTVRTVDPDFGGAPLEVEQVTLRKWANGDYRGVIGFESTAVPNNGQIAVINGALVVAGYNGGGANQPEVTLNWFESRTATVEVAPFHVGAKAEILVTVTDPDMNLDGRNREYLPLTKIGLVSDTQRELVGTANRDNMPSMGVCDFPHLPTVPGECNNPNFKGFTKGQDDPSLYDMGLIETGRDSGVFTGIFMVEVLENAEHALDGFVLVQGDERITISYTDEHDEQGHDRVVTTTTRWQQTYPGIPEMFADPDYREPIVAGDDIEGLGTIYIRLTDLDKRGAGTIKVRPASSSTGVTGLFVDLKESGLDTGEFLGSVELTTLPSFTKLKVTHNDKLYISYEDDLNELGQVGTAVRFPDIADLDPATGCGSAAPGASQAEIDRTGCVRWLESASAEIKFTEYFDWNNDEPDSSGLPNSAFLLPNDTPVSVYYGSATDPSPDVSAEFQEGVAVNVHVFDQFNTNQKFVHVTSDIDPWGFTLALEEDGQNPEIARGTFFLKEPDASQFTESDYFESDPNIPFVLSDGPEVNDPPRLYVRPGSEIYATFVDTSNADGDEVEVTAQAEWRKTQTGEIFIDKAFPFTATGSPSVNPSQVRPNHGTIYGDEGETRICVFDPDQDTGPVRDEVEVNVFSLANPDPGITMTLKETAPVGLSGSRSTGLFCGTLTVSTISSGSSRVLVPNAPGFHKINVRYIDQFDESGNQQYIVNWPHDNDVNDDLSRVPMYLEWRQEVDPQDVTAANPSAEDTQVWLDEDWYNIDMWSGSSVRAEVTMYVGTEVAEEDLPDERTVRISSDSDYVDLELFRLTGSRYLRGTLEMTNDPDADCTSCGDNPDEILRIGVTGGGVPSENDKIYIVDTPDNGAPPNTRWALKTFRDPGANEPDAKWRNGGAPQHGATITPAPPAGTPRAPLSGNVWQGSVFPPELCGVGTGPVFNPGGNSGDAGRLDGEGQVQACVILRDLDRNTDPQMPDLAFAEVGSGTGTEKISLLEVDETGNVAFDTGLFRGFVGFDVNQVVPGEGRVQVEHLDTISFEYTDPVYYNAQAIEETYIANTPTYTKALTWFQKYTGEISVFQDRLCEDPILPKADGSREFLGRGLICVQIADNDHNTRTTETDRIWAAALCETDRVMQNQVIPDWHKFQLFETGENSGVFQGIIEVQSLEVDGAGVPIQGEGILLVQEDGEQCDIIYTDAEADTDNNGAFLDDTTEGNNEEFVTLKIMSMNWVNSQDVLQAKLCRDEDCTPDQLLPDGQTKPGSIVQVFDKFSRRPIFGRGTYVIEVTDPDRFADVTPLSDTIEVLVFTDSDPQGVTIQLAERFGSMATSQRPRGSTEFIGSITFTEGPSIPGSSIQAAHGDEVTFRYNNPTAVNAAGESELDDIVVRDGIWRDVELGRIELLDDYYVGISDPTTQGAPPQEITLVDADRNIFADEKDWVGDYVTVWSDSDPNGFRFDTTDFEETGRNVGVFHHRVGFIPSSSSNPTTDQVGVGNRDIVTFTYRDDFDLNSQKTYVQETMRWFAEYETGWIDLDQDLYVSEAAVITVVVRDADLNSNPSAIESAQAWVCSDSDGGCESVALFEAKETDFSVPSRNSDAFVGQIGVETSFGAVDDGKLFVQDGDTIMAYYTDADESALDSALQPYAATDRATWVLRDNAPPTSILSATPLAVEKGDTINFTLTGSDDKGIVEWTLAFGDGKTVSGNEDLGLTTVYVEHFYTTNGTKQAVLTVKDDRGVSDTATVSIKVGTPPRVCNPQTDPNQCGTKQIPLVDPADQFAVNKDIQTSVRVFCEGNDARITWRLPANPPAPIVGVQMWRNGGSGYDLVATLPSNSPQFIAGNYIDVAAGCNGKYKVSAYYGEADFAGFSSGDSSTVEDFDKLKSTSYDEPNNFPWWGWLMVGLGVLLFIVLAVVYIVLRQTTKEPVTRQPDDDGYAYEDEPEEMEDAGEEATLQQHQIRCPTCANEFTATGAKPLAVSCPQCGTRGMLK